MLYGTKWILVGLGFSRVITAGSLVLTRGAIRATQRPWAAWNLVRAVRSVFPSKQAVTALSVRHLHAVHVLYIQYRWAGLGRHSSDLFLSGDALP